MLLHMSMNAESRDRIGSWLQAELRRQRGPRETVVIVGGGCAGVLVAAHVMRADRQPRRIVVFEPRIALGAGVAYSTDHPRHVLNVPARSMSAFDDDPGHFVAWLAAHESGLGPDDFAPRRVYRRYLNDVLRQAHREAAPGTTLTWERQRVTGLAAAYRDGQPVTTVRFGRDQKLAADRVVLAVGAPPATTLSSLRVPRGAAVVTDPWRPGAIESIPNGGDILIVGTGLTMVDVALTLAERRGWNRIHARSRRGLLPTVHTAGGFSSWPGFDLGQPTTAREVLQRMRAISIEAQSAGQDWRTVISAARKAAPEVWGRLDDTERRRLLRHAGSYWDVARHRMAPEVGASIDELRRSGRLVVGRGRVVDVRSEGPQRGDGPLSVRLAGPGGRRETLRVRAVLDCTGPGATSPLHASLIADGIARTDPSGVGLAVDDLGDLISVGGQAGQAIHTIGWCRRGHLFESTAVPELRVQAARLAQRIADEADAFGPHRLPQAVSA